MPLSGQLPAARTRSTGASGPSGTAGPPFAVRTRLAGTRLALAVLLAGLLALVGRHLAPALRVLLDTPALLGRHGLVLSEPLENLLLLLRRQPLEALVRGVELAFPLLGQRLPPPEVLRDASPIGRRHVAQPLLILARGLPLLGRETLPVAVVLDRPLPLLLSCYEEVKGGRTTTTESVKDEEVVLRLPKSIAPIKTAILPLSRKDELTKPARDIYHDLQKQFMCQYDETASIGKRYRRQDETGTPFCVTFDFDSLEDKKVTVRDRDTMKQERVAISELKDYLKKQLE